MNSERSAQNLTVSFLTSKLGYSLTPPSPYPVNQPILSHFLSQHNYSHSQISRALSALTSLSQNQSDPLLQVNKSVYSLLRFGLQGSSKDKNNIHFIDWEHPKRNTFTLSQEVSVKCPDGLSEKRFDLVLSVNGIALAVIELKKASVSVDEAAAQLLTYQRRDNASRFFSTVQLLIAANESQGLRYGVIGTPPKFFFSWNEDPRASDKTSLTVRSIQAKTDNPLLRSLVPLCLPERLLSLSHDFIVFEPDAKKTARHNQFFAVLAAQQRITHHEGGIIWNTQGSGKSLIMLWLAQWLSEHGRRTVIITDREELDAQIEALFTNSGRGRIFKRARNSSHLRELLASTEYSVVSSLIHKYGHSSDIDHYTRSLTDGLADGFRPAGDITAFIDECHRSNSGVLHEAVRKLMPGAVLIGFTGTPLLRTDKRTSAEVFGPFIHTYKFNEGVRDGVILPLTYEARSVEQSLSDSEAIDSEFLRRTEGLTDEARHLLMKKWATFSKLYSSRERLERVAADIIADMNTLPGLADGRNNAILAAGSVYQACRYWEIFTAQGFSKCAVISSYDPEGKSSRAAALDLTLESEEDCKKKVYRAMLAGQKLGDFEREAIRMFKKSPSEMKLLIVVDKLLTGFDAPTAKYLYIDKSMKNHELFQAVCRVNRPYNGKDNGVIVDYMDLFRSIQSAVNDYTSEAFAGFGKEDIEGLITNRYDNAFAKMKACREGLAELLGNIEPHNSEAAKREYFCSSAPHMRNVLYRLVSSLTRAFSECCARLVSHYGYTDQEVHKLREQIRAYNELKEVVRLMSGDSVSRSYDADMRYILDTYVKAGVPETVSVIDEIAACEGRIDQINAKLPGDSSAKAEIIENNLAREIKIRFASNPKLYTTLADELGKLLLRRKFHAIDYSEYVRELSGLSRKILGLCSNGYPQEISDSPAKCAIYDYFGGNIALASALDEAVRRSVTPGFRENAQKKRQVQGAVYDCLLAASFPEREAEERTLELSRIIENQPEYA